MLRTFRSIYNNVNTVTHYETSKQTEHPYTHNSYSPIIELVSTGLRQKYTRSIQRWIKQRKISIRLLAALLIMSGLLYASVMERRRVDPTTYQPLLTLIAQVESNDNYNAYFGNAQNADIDFTIMTIDAVMKWQADFVASGNPSSAVGRYQIINTTLSGLVGELNIDTSQKFDQATQDQLAIALLERRGSEDYVNEELTREQFAANLAKEWAALPKVLGDNPENSYYAGDGLNTSRTKVSDVINAIKPISAQ